MGFLVDKARREVLTKAFSLARTSDEFVALAIKKSGKAGVPARTACLLHIGSPLLLTEDAAGLQLSDQLQVRQPRLIKFISACVSCNPGFSNILYGRASIRSPCLLLFSYGDSVLGCSPFRRNILTSAYCNLPGIYQWYYSRTYQGYS